MKVASSRVQVKGKKGIGRHSDFYSTLFSGGRLQDSNVFGRTGFFFFFLLVCRVIRFLLDTPLNGKSDLVCYFGFALL